VSRALGRKKISRRDLLRFSGGAAIVAAGAGVLSQWNGKILGPSTADAATRLLASPQPTIYRHLIATDGWTHLTGNIPPYFPDPLAPEERAGGIYTFGFRDVTALDGGPSVPTPAVTTNSKILAQKGKTQASAPLLYFDEGDAIQVTLTNLGLQQRPDLTDSHTIHWHGFRNALPAFDGVPEMSVAAPVGRDLPYYYHPTDPGTYMYHCHFEDVEHVQMGMTGIVFVRPTQNKTGAAGGPVARYNGGGTGAPLGYVYNDGVVPGTALSTAYDREFGIFLSEAWATVRYHDAHIQETDWSDFRADFFLLNGRAYPDTLAPSGGGIDMTTGDAIAPAGRLDLRYQPISSLIRCNAGDRVLLRFVNLGYTQCSMRLAGIKMHVIGKDATPLRGLSGGARTGADTSYYTDTIHIGAGESYDAIFTAPPGPTSGYDTYVLHNTAKGALTNPGASGLGGQLTEVRVYKAGALPPQTTPNE
jgi:FtsP/CotA-like multicopper oxidase with cupredoxin domain